MRSSRLLSILLRLQTEGCVPAQALAEAFEVSVRTIYRDIDSLSAAGVPVYAEHGRNGGFRLQDGYRTRLTGLDRQEALNLFLAGAPFAAEQLGLGGAFETMRMKLLEALPQEAARDAQRVASRFHLDPVAWFHGTDEQRCLPELAAAVWNGHTIRLRYDSWKGLVDRRVAPLGLVQKAGLWYLVAAANGQPRTYRVGSIETLQVEDEVAPVPRDFDLRRYWTHFARDYEARMRTMEAQVRARPTALRALARPSHAMSVAVAAAGPVDDAGWHVLQIPIESIEAATAELLRFGPDVVAISPRPLVTALRHRTRELARLYSMPGGARKKR
jgi:predicted DNA-binding transcriptional regulator YafY